ncbi:MAG: Zn-ribbon domain-containing OB-fold protein [Methanomassiliicoccales archaeon]|nr:MAG: Zn-ribbon domain-containing OB-fold protein [Methanomassiliicoccales archaeon]
MGIPRFWRETPSRYNLIGTKCGSCGMIHFPPRVICPSCHRKSIGKMERTHLSGKGTIVSYSIVHDAPHSFEMQKPYVVAIIELEGGCRLTAPIIDCSPSDVAIGMDVEATFRKLGEQGEDGVIHYGYKFRPAREATK